MPEAKIQIKLGPIEFLGEGEQTWLASQLDKILSHSQKLPEPSGKSGADKGGEAKDSDGKGKEDKAGSTSPDAGKDKAGRSTTGDQEPLHQAVQGVSLVAFLKKKKVGDNQAKIFLATAIWRAGTKGVKVDTIFQVDSTLTGNGLPKLKSAKASLQQNASQGFCVDAQKGNFFVETKGFASMGITKDF